MKFNADGSLDVIKKARKDHITLFLFINELSFSLGKKLLIQGLRGEVNEKTKKCFLHKKIYFGSLGGYSEDELMVFLDALLARDLIEIKKEKGIYQVLVLSRKGKQELEERALSLNIDDIVKKRDEEPSHQFVAPTYKISEITENDKKLFSQLDFFLGKFTYQQKKAIICNDAKQLCIAGAGSGKTSVLTHKIVYLVNFGGVDPKDILAVTFTRKAKQEMISRLSKLLPEKEIRVETFNSFSEKELLKNGTKFYGINKRMVSHKEFNQLVIQGLNQIGFSVDMFISHYFTSRERRNKEQRQLFFSFMYDFRAILDTYIERDGDPDHFKEKIATATFSERITAQNLVKLCAFVHKQLQEQNLRTYTDQLIDVNKLYVQHPDIMPNYSWILVDEYQDVSKEQKELIKHLNPKQLFVVGDPRQSIYAWRGSNPETIYEYIDDKTSVVELNHNFRSSKAVVKFANTLIGQTHNGKNSYAALESSTDDNGHVFVTNYKNEDDEVKGIIDYLEGIGAPRNEMFILSRTNKSLQKFQELCDARRIKYVLRTDEKKDLDRIPFEDEITLSTVHSIKGLEAEFVFVPGSNFLNYPCKAKDHHYVDLLATKDDYDQFEEERRLLYVACTRAKRELHVSYSGGISPFLSRHVVNTTTGRVEKQEKLGMEKIAVDPGVMETQRAALKRWRYLESQDRSIPAYMIFNDRAMEELLEVQPMTVEELLDISGLGKAKIREFGEDILRVLYK